ncbi:AraC family transcriptional regulator [Kribbella sp. VKM Ac-2568]|uniref:AraC family transcriptional regulator n=1 Tax=Kribbella sp. VKM Ac-2568 TaxID=2512219 RepID=UPI001051EB18|nr:AraC family transcriptional regulator [Kribbella sp. VKM Ac-2568]TCM45015.1 AraC-like DNA-binding protein [Kribbella sp. VKM Ac-2568]
MTGFTLNPSATVLLTDLGISVPNVLRRASLPEVTFTEAAATLTVSQYYALWRALDEEADDPHLPIRIGTAISVEAFDPPIFAALCSPDLKLAATRIAQYKKLIGPLRLAINSSPGTTTIETHWPHGSNPPDALVLTELIFWVALARIATRTEVRPVHVHAPLRLADPAAYTEYLGVTIEHAATASITFSARDAEKPFLTANSQMWEYFEPGLRRRLSDLDRDSSTTELVRAVLLRLLPAGSATMPAVARELAVSTRTLQRRLNLESTTFQLVLRETRESLARHYLSTPQLTAGEISYLLGYDDTNSFYRAFHTWTGRTPEHARTQA